MLVNIREEAEKRRRICGSHNIFAHNGNPSTLTVSVHGNKGLKIGMPSWLP